MPNRQDFSVLYGKGEIPINTTGWVPLTIEFAYGYVGNLPNFFWRVKGTEHTFRIPVNQLNELTKGNYEQHIKDFIEGFRKEYLSWAGGGFQEEWMREYHREYRNYIKF